MSKVVLSLFFDKKKKIAYYCQKCVFKSHLMSISCSNSKTIIYVFHSNRVDVTEFGHITTVCRNLFTTHMSMHERPQSTSLSIYFDISINLFLCG